MFWEGLPTQALPNRWLPGGRTLPGLPEWNARDAPVAVAEQERLA
jgi:hypothetical protein